MDEESLRNRLLNRLKDQQQESTSKDVEISSITKSQDSTRMNITLDSEISSGDMADSYKGEDDNPTKERVKKTHTQQKQSRERREKGKEVKSEKTPHDTKRKTHNNKSEQKNEKDKKTKKEKDGKKEKQQQKSVVRLKKNSKSARRSPSPAKRSRSRRETSPDQKYKKHRDRSHSGSRARRHRSKSPDRRRRKSVSRNRDRYHVSPRRDRHSPTRRESRSRRSPRRRRYYSRSRSRSVGYGSEADSTTSFSISSYGSDMDTSLRERDVTSTTSGVPAGFGQGLYIPQLNQSEENKGGIGHLLTAIRQGQNLQSKSTAIAQYTAIFQQISAREDEQKPSSTEEPTVETTQESSHESKFKFVEQEFPVSHGSEHRKAAFHSEIATTNEVTEEQQPFTDPASLSKMMLGIKPGKYIGDKAVCLPLSQLEGGDPAWVKKNQFKGLAPVRDGIGRKLMEKMGWREGMPLGKSGYGPVIPLELDVKTDRKGLGVGSNKDFSYLPLLLPPVNNTPFYSPVPMNTTASPAGVLELSSRLEPNALAGGKHPVCVLMEICAKRHWSNPVFEEVGEQGPKFFKYRVKTSMGCYQPQFNSVTKKEAKRQAALACLQALGQVPAKDMTLPTLPLPPQNIQHSQVIQSIPLTSQYPSLPCPRPISVPLFNPPLIPQALAPTYIPTNAVPGVSHIPVYQKPYTM